MKSPSCFVVVLAVFTLAPGLIRHDRSTDAYRSLAQQSAFDAVVPIMADSRTVGSAVHIAPSWILTAYHVLRNAGIQVDVQIGNTTYRPMRVIRHPEADLALLELPTPVEAYPTALLYRDSLELHKKGVSVGFGIVGTGNETMRTMWDESLTRMGIKHAGENMIDATPKPSLLQADFDHPSDPRYSTLGDSAALDLEYIPMRGDSGGGLFIQIDDQWQLAGITINQQTPKRTPNSGAHFLDTIGYGWLAQWHRVSHFTDWIDQHIRAPDNQGSNNR